MNEISEKDLKDLLFEVFSAGFESGCSGQVDLATAFEQFYEKIMTDLKADLKKQAQPLLYKKK